jgi:hypothetical protein
MLTRNYRSNCGRPMARSCERLTTRLRGFEQGPSASAKPASIPLLRRDSKQYLGRALAGSARNESSQPLESNERAVDDTSSVGLLPINRVLGKWLPESRHEAESLAILSGSTRSVMEDLSRWYYWPAMTHRAAKGVLLLDHYSGTLRHPLHRIRPAGATPTVGVQLNLRYAANAEPLFLHWLPQLPLPLSRWHLFSKQWLGQDRDENSFS